MLNAAKPDVMFLIQVVLCLSLDSLDILSRVTHKHIKRKDVKQRKPSQQFFCSRGFLHQKRWTKEFQGKRWTLHFFQVTSNWTYVGPLWSSQSFGMNNQFTHTTMLASSKWPGSSWRWKIIDFRYRSVFLKDARIMLQTANNAPFIYSKFASGRVNNPGCMNTETLVKTTNKFLAAKDLFSYRNINDISNPNAFYTGNHKYRTKEHRFQLERFGETKHPCWAAQISRWNLQTCSVSTFKNIHPNYFCGYPLQEFNLDIQK